jgi:hypothetical protein
MKSLNSANLATQVIVHNQLEQEQAKQAWTLIPNKLGIKRRETVNHLPPLVIQQPSLSSAWLSATRVFALLFTLALLTFTFLSLALFLLSAALLPGIGFAWLVWILLSFHMTFHCYVANF